MDPIANIWTESLKIALPEEISETPDACQEWMQSMLNVRKKTQRKLKSRCDNGLYFDCGIKIKDEENVKLINSELPKLRNSLQHVEAHCKIEKAMVADISRFVERLLVTPNVKIIVALCSIGPIEELAVRLKDYGSVVITASQSTRERLSTTQKFKLDADKRVVMLQKYVASGLFFHDTTGKEPRVMLNMSSGDTLLDEKMVNRIHGEDEAGTSYFLNCYPSCDEQRKNVYPKISEEEFFVIL